VHIIAIADALLFIADGFVFLSYDQPSGGPGKTTQPMKLTSSTSAIVKCTKSNALQHCANQAGTTQSNQVTTSNTVGFTATTTLTLTVRLLPGRRYAAFHERSILQCRRLGSAAGLRVVQRKF